MLNLENFKKKTLDVCTDISIKGITFFVKPAAKVMKHLVELNKLTNHTAVKAAVEFDDESHSTDSLYFQQLKSMIVSSQKNLKRRGFSFNKITRDKPREIKKTEDLKVSE